MANGSVLQELRSLLSQDEIPQTAATRLILGGLADVYETLIRHVALDDARDERLAALDRKTDSIVDTSKRSNQEIEKLKDAVAKINQNPSIVFGNFFKAHPKIVVTVVIIIFVVLAVPELRAALTALLGLPKELFQLIP